MAAEEIGTPAGRPSMMATSSGPWDSPAVSTRSISLVSPERLTHGRQHGGLVRQGIARVCGDADAHLEQGLMKEHPEAGRGRVPGRLPRVRQRHAPGALHDLPEPPPRLDQQSTIEGK